MEIRVKANAKINLTLDALAKRPDGFHEVEMVMTTLELADYISVAARTDQEIVIETTSGLIPNDQQNLCFKVADLMRRTYGIKNGVTITIEKNIPVAAGLAGGSADAAATFHALNQLWELNLSLEKLEILGAMIGSDVPFCLWNTTALATGRGEKLQALPAPPKCWVVLAKPQIGLSTAEVYGNLDIETAPHPQTQTMIKALEEQDYALMCQTLGNSLEAVSLKLCDQIQQIKLVMEQSGADGVLMSGSGPTVFAFTQSESRKNRIVNSLKGFCYTVIETRMKG
ncbi:MAG: 4-(cytidine 5'-diphospho)-2-C-methyl-D-erythritol kinase [Culicoidibacterales bacterium]